MEIISMDKVKKSVLLMSIAALTILGGTSCRRYDEGPALSFRFKETRVEGFWYFEKYEITYDDGTVLDAVADSLITQEWAYAEFTKGGFYEIVNESADGFGAESGIWHMGQGWKGKDYMEVDKNDRVVNYYVKKMTNDHLKYEYRDKHPTTEDSVNFVIHLIPKIL